MAERLTSNATAVEQQDERSPSQRRRGREQPQHDPPLTNGADQGAAGLSKAAPHDDVAADWHKPKKKARKKKKAQAALHGLDESPTTYDPGSAPPGVSAAALTADALARPPLPRPLG